MREIIFRGRRIDNGEWVEGFFYQHPLTKECFIGVHDFNSYSIAYMGNLGCPVFSKIIPETLGQYTGLKDLNGVRIFEGDIIRYIYEPGKGFWNANQLSVIQYGKTGWQFDGIMGTNKYALMTGCLSAIPFNQDLENIPEFEVIGNIHDNPEIAEGAR